MDLHRRHRQHSVDVLFVLLLFCVLAICALSVVTIGAGVYRNTVAGMDDNYSTGTSLAYLTTKIRQNDIGGAVYVGEVEGSPALVLEHNYEAGVWCTYIFHDGGALKEVMLPQGTPCTLLDGQTILEVERFSISRETDRLLRLAAVDQNGVEVSVLAALRSEEQPV